LSFIELLSPCLISVRNNFQFAFDFSSPPFAILTDALPLQLEVRQKGISGGAKITVANKKIKNSEITGS